MPGRGRPRKQVKRDGSNHKQKRPSDEIFGQFFLLFLIKVWDIYYVAGVEDAWKAKGCGREAYHEAYPSYQGYLLPAC
jgi:hypothetical protein